MPRQHELDKNAHSGVGTATHNGKKEKEAQPFIDERGEVIQEFGKAIRMPIALDEKVCSESIGLLNQILADTMSLRDLYKKHHWQVAGHTFINCICCLTSILRSK